MNNEIVCVKNVSKIFSEQTKETKVLSDINLRVASSEFVSVMGPSGCGKSTLLYLIGGLDNPSSGSIFFCGQNLAKLSDKKQSDIRLHNIGFVFQFCNLVQNLSVRENVLLPAIMAGKNLSEYRKRADQLLNEMGLADKCDNMPRTLSGGQQQRTALARAVIMEPELILADEPTGNLDSKSGDVVLKLLSRLNTEKGITVIMVTHSEQAAAYGRRILEMRDGCLSQR